MKKQQKYNSGLDLCVQKEKENSWKNKSLLKDLNLFTYGSMKNDNDAIIVYSHKILWSFKEGY